MNAEYRQLEKRLRETHPQSPEFIPLWQQLEALKNANGGNVPEFEDFADQSKLLGK